MVYMSYGYRESHTILTMHTEYQDHNSPVGRVETEVELLLHGSDAVIAVEGRG